VGDNSLEALQRFVADSALRDRAIGRDAGLVAEAERLVLPSSRGMSPADRLDVYREQFWLRHVPSLEEDFPTLSWAVGGPPRFQDLATEYLSACPPRTWDLQRLGESLPAHVAHHPRWQGDILVRDAARLDWAFMEAFDAPDVAPFDPRSLTAVTEDAWALATVVFHPSVRALSFAYPVHELRQALKSDSAPQRPLPANAHVVVWRDATCVLQAVEIEGPAHALLAALTIGTPLGEACDVAARAVESRDPSELGTKVSSWFQQWTASGWVSALRFNA
jgi:hypothetical protein